MKKKTTERSNLIQLMKAAKVGDNELSVRTGLPPTTIYRLKVGTTDPRLSTIKGLADFFHVTLGQIVGEEPLDPDFIHPNKVKDSMVFSKIPVLNWEQIIHWKEKITSLSEHNHYEWTYTDLVKPNKSFALKIQTNEYGSQFPKDSLIFVEEVLSPNYPYYAIISNISNQDLQESSIMKVIKTTSGDYLIHPENSNIVFPWDKEKHQITGIIIGIKSKFSNNFD